MTRIKSSWDYVVEHADCSTLTEAVADHCGRLDIEHGGIEEIIDAGDGWFNVWLYEPDGRGDAFEVRVNVKDLEG